MKPFIAALLISCTALIMCTSLPARAQSDTENPSATPLKGEGIYSLLRRNGYTPSAILADEFIAANKDRLSGKKGLKLNVRYRLPSKVRMERHPIFGPDYQDVEIRSTALKDDVYYLVSGHGGPDPGAQGTRAGRTLSEDEYAYDTMLRTARALIEQSATVYIIVQDNDGIRDVQYLKSDTDEKHLGNRPISLNQLKRLRDRVSIINHLYEKHRKTARIQRMIEIHVDSRISKSTQIDVNFYYTSKGGYALSKDLQNTFRSQYRKVQPDRPYNGKIVDRGGLYMLRQTKPVSILIELANIQHRGDQVRITKPENRQTLAEWIAKGLIAEANS